MEVQPFKIFNHRYGIDIDWPNESYSVRIGANWTLAQDSKAEEKGSETQEIIKVEKKTYSGLRKVNF